MAIKQVGSLWSEFKAFAFKGNLIDLAVAVVLGTAFGAVVNSVVADIIMPLINAALGGAMGYETWTLGPVRIGRFLAALVNFLLVALAIFITIVKVMGAVVKRATPPGPSEPTNKECPYCLQTIPLKATRCAHCTSELAAGPVTPAPAA